MMTRLNDVSGGSYANRFRRFRAVAGEMDGIVYGLDRLYDDALMCGSHRRMRCRIAIDFHQLYNLAFPMEDILTKYSDHIPGKREIQERVYEYGRARAVFQLADVYGAPILLPPYLAELRRAVVMRRSRHLQEYMRSKVSELLGGTLLPPETVAEMRDIARELREAPDPEAHKNAVTKASKVLLRHFTAITVIDLAMGVKGFERLQALLEEEEPEHVVMVSRAYRQYASSIGNPDGLDVDVAKWRKQLDAARSSPMSNERDALAIATAFHINRRLQEDRANEYLVLLSDATTMQRVLNWDLAALRQEVLDAGRAAGYERGVLPLQVEEGMGEARLLRTSETYMWQIVLRGDEDFPASDTLRRELARFDKYRIMRTALVEMGEAVGDGEDCSANGGRGAEFDRALAQYERYAEELKEVRLAGGFGLALLERAERAVRGDLASYEQGIEELVRSVADGAEAFDELVRNRLRELAFALESSGNSLRDILFGEGSRRFAGLGVGLRMFNIIPWGVPFEDARLQELFDRLRPRELRKNPGSTGHVFLDLLKCLDVLPNACERRLLLAVALLMVEEFDSAIRVLGESGEWVGRQWEFVRKYLLCLAWHRKARMTRSQHYVEMTRQTLRQLLSTEAEDARSWYLAGLVWTQWSQDGFVPLGEGVRSGLTHTQRALRLSERVDVSPYIRCSIHNNLLYGAYLGSQCGLRVLTLEFVERHLRGMRELEIDNWIPAFHDTAHVVCGWAARRTKSATRRQRLSRKVEYHRSMVEADLGSIDMPRPERAELEANLRQAGVWAARSEH